MTGTVRLVVTLTIFATTIVLVVVRPRRWNEAWWTMLGAAALLALGLVTPREAINATVIGKNALLFLFSLLALSLLVGKSGFFDWAAIRSAHHARGNARALYRNTFVLGAIVTAILSLDTTAVMLTPVTVALVKRLKLPAAPYIVLCAIVANVGSLALPISNLTNILFADAFHLTFAAFAARLIAPQLVALAATHALLCRHFRRDLPSRFDSESLPEPASVVPHQGYFLVCVTVLAVVLIGYFLAPLLALEPYVIALAGSGVLAVVGAATGQVRLGAARELSWGLFPFVVGLFVAVQALENLGLIGVASGWLAQMKPGAPGTLLAAAGTTACASNIINNLPAALIARSVLLASHAQTGTVLAALIGADVGAIITPFGSLAHMLVLALARQEGEEVDSRRLLVLGLWLAPVLVVATTLTLALTFAVVR
jgi:arsenical pump membrane protein